MVFGAVMTWLVALTVASRAILIGDALSSTFDAAVASLVIVYVSKFFAFSNVPATFYGFASAFAFLLLSKGVFSATAMTSLGAKNVVLCVPPSLVAESFLGVIHRQLAARLTAPERRTTVGAMRLTAPT